MELIISDEISAVCPELHIMAIACKMRNTKSDPLLWEEIARMEHTIRNDCTIEDIKNKFPVKTTRQAYKRLGKDPNRYRPSAESLYRRILRELPLYKINTLVDIVNLLSIKSGYSIGAFDVDKIIGEKIILGVGREGEPYKGIGRGELNISGLPVYRDGMGGIGTPTSDEERTKIELETTTLLMIVNAYSGGDGLTELSEYAIQLLERYVSAINLKLGFLNARTKTEIII